MKSDIRALYKYIAIFFLNVYRNIKIFKQGKMMKKKYEK